MYCPKCRVDSMTEDTFCRQCGNELVETSRSMVTTHQVSLPAVLYNPQVSKSVAAGVGAIALGVGIELLRRNLLARLAPSPRMVASTLPSVKNIKDVLMPQNEKTTKLPKGYEVQETVVYMQRVIRRAR
ncbi:hypothetical protein KSD_05820 [Ktedonobacter sp. SOSP1-85]|nr:hypothetical protein KSC_067540 [Ktedonobacter sp. SOSP1-52]GHO72811.1 hypothetical protein KSD_05820 [Ktedonobacter sp. SOSP1-85]